MPRQRRCFGGDSAFRRRPQGRGSGGGEMAAGQRAQGGRSAAGRAGQRRAGQGERRPVPTAGLLPGQPRLPGGSPRAGGCCGAGLGPRDLGGLPSSTPLRLRGNPAPAGRGPGRGCPRSAREGAAAWPGAVRGRAAGSAGCQEASSSPCGPVTRGRGHELKHRRVPLDIGHHFFL